MYNILIKIHKLIFHKRTKNTQWGKNILFKKWYGENQIFTYEIIKLDPYLYTTHKN